MEKRYNLIIKKDGEELIHYPSLNILDKIVFLITYSSLMLMIGENRAYAIARNVISPKNKNLEKTLKGDEK